MRMPSAFIAVLLAHLASLTFVSPARAIRPVVLDGGDFFKPETIEQVNQILAGIPPAPEARALSALPACGVLA